MSSKRFGKRVKKNPRKLRQVRRRSARQASCKNTTIPSGRILAKRRLERLC
jgi:hypothetical protein